MYQLMDRSVKQQQAKALQDNAMDSNDKPGSPAAMIDIGHRLALPAKWVFGITAAWPPAAIVCTSVTATLIQRRCAGAY